MHLKFHATLLVALAATSVNGIALRPSLVDEDDIQSKQVGAVDASDDSNDISSSIDDSHNLPNWSDDSDDFIPYPSSDSDQESSQETGRSEIAFALNRSLAHLLLGVLVLDRKPGIHTVFILALLNLTFKLMDKNINEIIDVWPLMLVAMFTSNSDSS